MQPIILMYHRIAPLAVDPWQLAVAPSRFEEQLAVICQLREPFAMTDFVDRLEKGCLPVNAVSVTFDDGYVDNFQTAKPQLERAGVPATVFITTGNVLAANEFWWDELARLVLGYDGDLDCEIIIAGQRLSLTLRTSSTDTSTHPRWEAWQYPPTEQESVYIQLWRRLRPLPSIEREEVMSNLRSILTSELARPEDLPMSSSQVRELVADGLIEIGAHSMTHPMLTTIPLEERSHEIILSKRFCEQFTDRTAQGFAYPYGAVDEKTREIVHRAGFRFACSTKNQFVDPERFDRFDLPRLHVMDCGAEAFERLLLRGREPAWGSFQNSVRRLTDLVKYHSRRFL